MADTASHPSDQALLRAVDGELTTRQADAVEEHLVACQTCRMRAATIRAVMTDASNVCRDSPTTDADAADVLRARLNARMTALSTEWDRSWQVRLVERVNTLPRGAVAVAILVGIVVLARMSSAPQSAQSETGPVSIESAALPIPSVTPGAAQLIGRDDVCAGRTPGRQPIPAAVRLAILRAYRMERVPPYEYELDYLITPELGGTSDQRNLWPERYASREWNARVKDGLEQLLPQLVCRGDVDLATAQRDIAANWIGAYKKYFHVDHPIDTHARRATEDDGSPARTPRLIGLFSAGRYQRPSP